MTQPFADVVPERRELMRRVKRANTKPELLVRRTLHAMGKRFRLHRRDLPGRPDIVLPRHRIAIFVHGCFWHRHSGCRAATMPKTRADYWAGKFEDNVKRDRSAEERLSKAGWRVVIVWECQTKDPQRLKTLLCEHIL